MNDSDLVIMTVTYGDRFEKLFHGPLKTARLNCSKLVIICNGVEDSYREKLEQLVLDEDINIDCVFLAENLGSAGGFKTGMTYVNKLNYKFLLILDDDNLIDSKIKLSSLVLNKANFIPRKGRKYIDVALEGFNPSPYLAENNSFLGFSLKRIAYKTFLRKKEKVDLKEFSFPWAPYGGLLLEQSVLDSNILPNAEFYLYCDDVDFSHRIADVFGLYLIDSLTITDVDESWNVSDKGNVITRIITGEESWRVYYSVRNQVYFDKKRKNNTLLFSINIALFAVIYLIISIISFNKSKGLSRHKLILSAAINGFRGSLGKI